MKWQSFGIKIFITLTYKTTNAAYSDGATQQKGEGASEGNRIEQQEEGGKRRGVSHPSCGYYLLLKFYYY